MYFDDCRRLRGFRPPSAGRVRLDGGFELAALPRRSVPVTLEAGEARGGRPPGLPSAPSLAAADERVPENLAFRVPVVLPAGRERAASALLLFHGLNERSWEKYLPWALELCRRTGRAVALFPLAFHMDRAPAEWSNPRLMIPAAEERRRLFGPLPALTMANVALSTRLQERPERFILSGLQTCRDVAGFLDDLRAGRLPCLAAGAPVDLFGYSIGALLAEVLLLADPGGRLRGSKAFLFCGGSTLGGMAPVSRWILDGGAGAALRAFLDGRLEEELAGGSPLARLFERIQALGTVFLSLLRHERLAAFREAGLRALGPRLAAVVLAGDRVIPGREVARTLAVGPGPSGSRVRVLDFPFPYTHENPFPLLDRFREEVSACFGEVFGLAADHLAGWTRPEPGLASPRTACCPPPAPPPVPPDT